MNIFQRFIMMAHFRIPPPPPVVERVRPTTMGDLQHFCLRWNNYQNSITTAFENLRDDEDFIDVTLACDGKTLKAHRVVLSACSPYFKELLKSTPCKHPVIVLQDVVFDDLHALVEFIYHGEVNVHQRNLTSFLKTAEVLKVSGLTQQNVAAPSTPASSASPSSDHYSENLSTRFTMRSPSTPPDKASLLQPPFIHSLPQLNNSSEDRNSPRALQQTRHRRHIRSPTPIRSSYARDESPISLKRAKSVDNPSPLLNCSTNVSPPTVLTDEPMPSRNRKNSDGSSSSRRNSPNNLNNNNNNNNNSNNNNNYDENHNAEDSTTADDRANDDEPPVDFSTNISKKYLQLPSQYPSPKSSSPKNLSLKTEPMDLVSNHSSSNNNSINNNNETDIDNNNQFNDDDSNQSDDRLSDHSPLSTNPYANALLDREETFGHRNYLEGAGKLFAAAGASFSFNMAAAALAADSIAGFNHHQSHPGSTGGSVIDGLGGTSQDWMELERRGGNQGHGGGVGGGQQQHSCFICGKMLSTRLTLKRHIEQQHHQPLHSAVCTVCHKVFRTLNSLNNHKSIYHRKPKWSTSSSTINS